MSEIKKKLLLLALTCTLNIYGYDEETDTNLDEIDEPMTHIEMREEDYEPDEKAIEPDMNARANSQEYYEQQYDENTYVEQYTEETETTTEATISTQKQVTTTTEQIKTTTKRKTTTSTTKTTENDECDIRKYNTSIITDVNTLKGVYKLLYTWTFFKPSERSTMCKPFILNSPMKSDIEDRKKACKDLSVDWDSINLKISRKGVPSMYGLIYSESEGEFRVIDEVCMTRKIDFRGVVEGVMLIIVPSIINSGNLIGSTHLRSDIVRCIANHIDVKAYARLSKGRPCRV